jgi:hypothetical protein
MEFPPARQNKKLLVIIALIVSAVIAFGCGHGKSGSHSNSGGTNAEEPNYPPMNAGSRKLALDDASRGCSRLPELTERFEYCLQVVSGEDSASRGKYKASDIRNNQDARAAFDYFTNKRHLSRTAAAGIVGNLLAESGADPTAPNTAASGGGGGMAQWEGNRWDGKNGLKPFAKKRGKSWKNRDLQLEFIWWELHNTEKASLQPLVNANSPEDAAISFVLNYERARPGKTRHDDRRKAFARAVFKYF